MSDKKAVSPAYYKHEILPNDVKVFDAIFQQSISTFGWQIVFYRRLESGREQILKMPVDIFNEKNWMAFEGDLPKNGYLTLPWKWGEKLFKNFDKKADEWQEKYWALKAHLDDVKKVLKITETITEGKS